jgi:hypothetical protein
MLKITDAEYVSDFKVRITFSDSTIQIVNFQEFLNQNPHPQHDKYRDLKHFKNFRIERGNIVWGKDWDLIFPIEQLHSGEIKNQGLSLQ